MELTTNILPKNNNFKRKLRVQNSLIYCPAKDDSFTQISCSQNQFVTCSRCHSFYSPYCTSSGAIWKCGICGIQNQGDKTGVFDQFGHSQSVEIVIQSQKRIGPVYAIYLSLDFDIDNFVRAKIFLFSFLRHLPKYSKCIIILGSDNSEIAILSPPSQTYSTQIESKQIASVVRFPSIQSLAGLGLTNFFFTSENSLSAELAIERLSLSIDSDPYRKSLALAEILAKIVNPIHFISIFNEISWKHVDFEPLYRTMIRIDFFVTIHNSRTVEISKILPGVISLLSSSNPALQAQIVVEQNTEYQLVTKCNSSNCEVKFQQSLRPFNEVDDNSAFYPILIGKNHPLIVDIQNIDSRNDSAVLQFVSRHFFYEKDLLQTVLRISNFSLKTTEDFDEYLSSVNWNNLLWCWSRKIIGMNRDEGVAALLRIAAEVIKVSGGFSSKVITNDFLKALCSIPTAKAFFLSYEESIDYINYLLYTPPSEIHMIPLCIEADSNKICSSINGICESRGTANVESRAARKMQRNLPVFLDIEVPIPAEFLRISNHYLAILKRLVENDA